MKSLFCFSVLALFCLHLSAQDFSFLEKELQERIELNAQYKLDYAEGAKESAFANELVPLESQNGQDWVDFLTYVKKGDDIQLKLYVLKLEHQAELINYYYDLEYAESLSEKTEAFKEIEKYKAKMAALNAFETEWLASKVDDSVEEE